MANRKKSRNKKNNKSKNNNTKKNIIIVLYIILIVVIIIVLSAVLTKSKITCTKSVNGDVSIDSNATFYLKKNKIKYIEVSKKISVKDNNSINYLDAIKTSLENNYKKEGISYEASKSEGKLNVKLKYIKEKEYILDNLFIEKSNDGININLLSEDKENNYGTIDLSKEYSEEKIIKILKKADYTCKKWKKVKNSKKVEKMLDLLIKI